MKGYVCLFVLLVGTSLLAQSSAENEVIQVQQKWLQASQKGDTNALLEIIDDSFTGNTPNGFTIDKQTLFPPQGNDPVFTNTHFEDLSAKVIGNAAVVFSRMITSGKAGFLRCTMIYMRRGGQWRMVAAQLVPTTTELEKSSGGGQ